MGKRLKAGKKKREHIGKSGITWEVIDEAQRRIDKQIEDSKMEATQDATKTVQALAYYAMYLLGYKLQGIKRIYNKINQVSEEIVAGTLDFEQIYAELEKIGVEVEQ